MQRPAHPLAHSTFRALRGLAAAGLLAAAACGPAKSASEVELSKLPAYDAEATSKFDDSIDPYLAALSMDKPIYRGDLKLRDRCQSADFIVRAKLTTISEERAEEKRQFTLTFRPSARVAGKADAPDPLDIVIREGTPSFGMLINVRDRLRGKSAIVLGKRFHEGNQARVHAVVLADDPDAIAAVNENVALEELKK